MLLLLVLTAFVSAAESAFFSLSPSDTETLKNAKTSKDTLIIELTQRPKRLLATLLISLNFVNIAIVILSTFIMEGLFDFSASPTLGFLIQVVAVTFLILVLGEIMPKVYTIQNPLVAVRLLAYPTVIFEKIFYPLSSFLIASTTLIDRRVKKITKNISVEELSHALDLTSEQAIPEKDQEILKGIVKFGNTDVKQIMHARTEVTAFEYKTSFKELIDSISTSVYSRIPVYKETLDNIAGVIYIKDLLPYTDEQNFEWQKLLRPAFFVPENKKIDDLLREFQHNKIHLAIVVDEYGGTSGIVTLEDIIEEIIGDINDEFDDDDLVFSKLDDLNYVFEGKISLKDLCRILDIESSAIEESKGESDTLAGFIIELEKRIPVKGQKTTFNNLTFTVEAADARKVKRVKVTLSPEKQNDENE